MIFPFLIKTQKSIANNGFTVIELMVTITIIVLVTAVVLVNYSSFNSSVLLTNQAYVTAFDLREAQSLAVSVRGNQGAFKEEYGLHFDTTPGNDNKYILFQDNGTNNPAQYDPVTDKVIGTPNIVDPRFKINNLYVSNGSVTNSQVTTLDVTFKRPNFDAVMYSSSPTVGSITSAKIEFTPINGGLTRTVVISSSGQISVQ